MTILEALIQGIVQGLTEFLPVSSSGHLSLIQYFTGQSGETGAFFSILLHLGTLFAVLIAFFGTIRDLVLEFFSMVGDIFRGKMSMKNATPRRRMLVMLIISLLPMVITLFIKDILEGFSTDNSIVAEGVCFLITSVLLWISVKCVKGHRKAGQMNFKDALAIGTTQALAPLPGISRSGSTISVAVMLGLDRELAVSFSFIMGVPAVLGACILEVGDVMKNGIEVSAGAIIVGLISSLLFGLLAIRMVRWLVTSDKFKYFAWYTMILGILVLIIGIYENTAGHPIQQMVMAAMTKPV